MKRMHWMMKQERMLFLVNVKMQIPFKGEIKAKYDKDTSVYAMWARKEGERGVTADQIKSELEELIPGIRIDAINEADIFLALDEMYREASKLIKESMPQKHELVGYLQKDEILSLNLLTKIK